MKPGSWANASAMSRSTRCMRASIEPSPTRYVRMLTNMLSPFAAPPEERYSEARDSAAAARVRRCRGAGLPQETAGHDPDAARGLRGVLRRARGRGPRPRDVRADARGLAGGRLARGRAQH